MVKITKKMSIGEIVQKHPKTVEVFSKHGLHCIGCAIAEFETLEEGAAAHGININTLVKDLNKAITPKKKRKPAKKKVKK